MSRTDPMGAVWLWTDAAMDHHAWPGHAERPERRQAAVSGVRDAAGDALHMAETVPATDEEITRVHDAAYLALLVAAEARGGGWLDPDTYLVPGSLPAARLAAGATMAAACMALAGEAAVAFAAVRPPGHHAARGAGSGFCILNNVALAVAGLRADNRAQRVAILDWDVHHGDGTQAIFDADPDVCYASTHQWPLYPGTGRVEDAGSGAAGGTKHNRPLPPGSGDAAFVGAWRDELLPAVERFAPQALVASAGYDAHAADPLAHLAVTEAGYAQLGRLVGGMARRLGLPGVAVTLEGGYDLAALRASVAATVAGIREGLAGGRDGQR